MSRPTVAGEPGLVTGPGTSIGEASSDEAFRLFFEASPYGQVLVDADGRIVLVNRALQHLVGHRAEDLVGRPIGVLLPERHRVGHVELVHGYFEDPQVRMMGSGRDLAALNADGTEIPVEVGLSWLPWDGAEHAVATVADISTRSRLEHQLRRANAGLEEFLYVASHDLRSPLRGIRDLLDWVREDLGEGDDVLALVGVRRNLDRIEVRIDRMQALMDALLAYATSGADGRAMPGEWTRVDVADIVHGLLELDPVPAGFEVRVEVTVEPFLAVRTPLETMLRNLVANAVKHHDRKVGLIVVRARPDGSDCLLEVADDGPGVPPAAHERIFRLFQTLSDDEGPRRGGIGLALVKRIVGAHGGRIEVQSQVGVRGTTFRVWWPRFPRRGIT
jgi:PAS domain S-box-containing protein